MPKGVLNNKPWIFVHVPKVAGTSISAYLEVKLVNTPPRPNDCYGFINANKQWLSININPSLI